MKKNFITSEPDPGLHCLPFHLHLLDILLQCNAKLFHFRTVVLEYLGVQIFRLFCK